MRCDRCASDEDSVSRAKSVETNGFRKTWERALRTKTPPIPGHWCRMPHYERIEGEYAEVRTKLVSGKVNVPLDYRLIKKADTWHAYDVRADRESLMADGSRRKREESN